MLGWGPRQNLRGALRGLCLAAAGLGGLSGGDITAGLQRRQGKRKRREAHPRQVQVFVLEDCGQWALVAADRWALSLCWALVLPVWGDLIPETNPVRPALSHSAVENLGHREVKGAFQAHTAFRPLEPGSRDTPSTPYGLESLPGLTGSRSSC